MTAFSSPYPGLRPFDAEEADLFFGRETQVDELLRRLHSTRFLAVVGPSGCGKSSLVRAGMIAALESGFLVSAGSHWQFAIMRPGGRPMTELATALVEQTGLAPEDLDAPNAIGLLGATLRRGPLGLVEALHETPLPARTNLLVLVDQFEEIFRFRREGGIDEADAFIALLLESARQRDIPIYIVLTMRSDFFGDCAAFAGLPEELNRSQYLTPRLSREQRRMAIVGPARVFGGDAAADLVNRLLNEMSNDPDQLPLMQHLLMRMWTWQSVSPAGVAGQPAGGESAPRSLTLDDYDDVGGLRHALSNHANEAFDHLDDRQQAIAEALFRRLSERAPGSRDIRRPTLAAEIAALAGTTLSSVIEVVNVFRAPGCSFVVPPWPQPIDENTTLDISHEALIRQWDRLRAWAEDEAQSADHYRFLERNAQLWKQHRMALWGTPNLEMALDWRARAQPTELWARRYGGDFAAAMEFLDASAEARALQEAAQRTQRLRQVRHLRRVTAASVLAALLSAGTLAGIYWFGFAEHVSYYRTFVRRWGEPIGVGELTATQMQHRKTSLKFVQRGIHPDPHAWLHFSYTTNQIEAVDATGHCSPDNSVGTYLSESDRDFSPTHECRWLFVRDATSGQLVYENAYDASGSLRWGYEYLPNPNDPNHREAYYVGANGSLAHFQNSPASVIRITYSDSGEEVSDAYFDRDGKMQPGPDHAYGRRFEYDASGRQNSMTSMDQSGKDLNDTAGNATMRMTYDDAGDITRYLSMDAAGRPSLVKQGWYEARIEYDQYGEWMSQSFFDRQGRPAADDNGVHLTRVTHDDAGNERTVSYYDSQGRPTVSTDGYHRMEIRNLGPYGRSADTVFFDAQGRPTTDSHGAFEYRRTFDQSGFELTQQAFGMDHNPVPAISGCYEVRSSYNPDGTLKSVACFGKDGMPALSVSGNYIATLKYDDRGNVVEKRFFGRDGLPTTTNDGYHLWTAKYDLLGNSEETAYFDIDERPVSNTDKYHRVVTEHDQRGNETAQTYFNDEGQLVLGPQGYAKRTKIYDDHDNAIEIAYYDDNDELTEDGTEAAGYAIVRRQFDSNWRETEIAYFGKDDRLKAMSAGYATEHFSYNDNTTEIRYTDTDGRSIKFNDCAVVRETTGERSGMIEETSCIDEQGRRTAAESGVSIIRKKYDDHRHTLETSYLDAAERPTLSPEGRSVIRYRYDDAGHDIEDAYYGVDGKPIAGPDGVAMIRARYNSAGLQIEAAYFDVTGHPQLGSKGYASQRNSYDDQGRLVEVSYFGADGRPSRGEDGYQREAIRYDERGHVIERAYYAGNGKLVALSGGYAIQKIRWDSHGRELEQSYYGPDAQPVVTSDGYHRLSARYDDRGHLIEKTFYGAAGEPLIQPAGYATWRARYDQHGRMTEEAFFGLDGRPIARPDGYYREVVHYSEDGNKADEAFYGEDDRLHLSAAEGYAMSRAERVLYGPDGREIGHCPVGVPDSADGTPQCMDADGHRLVRRIAVVDVIAHSQAEQLGIHPGDILESYAGQEVMQRDDLIHLTAQQTVGARSLVLRRGAQRMVFTLEPGRIGIYMQMRFVPDQAPEPAADPK